MASRRFLACAVLAAIVLFETHASAQSRDSLVNGAVIGAAVGAGFGVAMNYALRDSDLTVGQYAYGAAVYGAIGAGIGLGVDALFSRSSPRPLGKQPRLLFAPAVGSNVGSTFLTAGTSAKVVRRTSGGVKGLAVRWRW